MSQYVCGRGVCDEIDPDMVAVMHLASREGALYRIAEGTQSGHRSVDPRRVELRFHVYCGK